MEEKLLCSHYEALIKGNDNSVVMEEMYAPIA